jgi:hypothetical protein
MAKGEEGVGARLQGSVNVALTLKLISRDSLSTVIVDSHYPAQGHRLPRRRQDAGDRAD